MVRLFLLRASATYLFLLSVLYCVTSIPEGFVADTLVRIPTGYAHIQDLSVGDEVLVSTFNEYVASEAITKIISHEIETIIRVNVDGDIIDMAENQLFLFHYNSDAFLYRKYMKVCIFLVHHCAQYG